MRGFKPRLIFLGVIALLVILGVGGWVYRSVNNNESPQETLATSKIEAVNQIPIEDRPYIMIGPRADGREVSLTVNRLEGTSSVEYELEYQAGTLLQGAFGKIDFSLQREPVIRNILLGSCSAGGKCSYHEDVNGGTLLLRYTNGESVILKGEWNFQLMSEEEGRFGSRDAKFTFDVGNTGLPARTYVIVAQTMGLPGPVEGEIVGGPYAVTLPQGVSLHTQEISIALRTDSTESDIKLLGWSEAGWIEYESKQSGKILEGTVDRPTTFIAIHTPSSP